MEDELWRVVSKHCECLVAVIVSDTGARWVSVQSFGWSGPETVHRQLSQGQKAVAICQSHLATSILSFGQILWLLAQPAWLLTQPPWGNP